MSQKKTAEMNCSNNELRRMMLDLNVTQNTDETRLRAAFLTQIRLHHTDKGGSAEKAKELTRSFRILKSCLDEGIQLPDPLDFNDDPNAPSTSRTFYRSGCRPAHQAPRQAPNPWATGTGDETDPSTFAHEFAPFSRRRRKKGGEANDRDFGSNGFGRAGGRASPRENGYFWGDDANEEQEARVLDLRRKVFANNYKYTNEDLSDYRDPYEKEGPTQDHHRVIRGGLTLRKDFGSANAASEYAELEFGRNFDEIQFYTNPIFEPILQKLEKNEESVSAFTEKLKTMVNLEWAMSEEFQNQTVIRGVRLTKVGDADGGDESLYKFTMPVGGGDELTNISAGIHVDVRSSIDENVCASAVVDNVVELDRTVVLFFLDAYRLQALLSNTRTVDLGVNASAFVYRSMLRSIEFIRQRRMDSIIYPSLQFREPFEAFERRREQQIGNYDFLAGDGFNDFQKSAVFSILTKVHRPYPFILFGPPGTGKTVTLVESIRQLTLQSPNNRILVCTPSRMAADNFAETLLDKNFIEPKYVFRMHSLSTSAVGRNRKLDPISYMPKEGRGRFYGIPSRLNLRVFRVIISTLSTSAYLISAGGLRGYFTHVFVDEAGQATEADTWIPIGGLVDPKITSLILAGDPRQLGPVVNSDILKSFGYGLSMLKRLIYSEPYENSDDRTMVVLKQTYRSHFKILRPCSYLFYNNMLMANEEDEVLYKLCEWEGLPTKGFPIVFHSSAGSDEVPGMNKSFSNLFEAQRVVDYVERIIADTGTKERDIGIISPYKNQVIKLRQLLSKRPGLTIDSVEGFQGSEREVIIISTVRTRRIGFLQCDLRLNTSISRAKSLLIVIGNDFLLRSHISWQKFVYYCRYHGGYLDNQGDKCTDLIPIDD